MFFSDSVDIFLLFPAIDVAVAKSKGGGLAFPIVSNILYLYIEN